MTNYQLRGQIGGQLVAVHGILDMLADADDTPVNVNMYELANTARGKLEGVYSTVPANSDGISDSLARTYNNANAYYKSLTSTFAEFGTTAWPSFADAVYDSATELPDTLGKAGGFIGDSIGGIVNGAGNFSTEIIKNTLVGFVKGFWPILLLAALALVAYFFGPKLITMTKAAVS